MKKGEQMKLSLGRIINSSLATSLKEGATKVIKSKTAKAAGLIGAGLALGATGTELVTHELDKQA